MRKPNVPHVIYIDWEDFHRVFGVENVDAWYGRIYRVPEACQDTTARASLEQWKRPVTGRFKSRGRTWFVFDLDNGEFEEKLGKAYAFHFETRREARLYRAWLARECKKTPYLTTVTQPVQFFLV